jgi:VCBS repeat-containing protein
MQSKRVESPTAPTGSNGTGNVLSNDTDVDSNVNGETKTVTGVAAGVQSSSVGSVSSVVNGSYGSITIAANGSYTYAIDDTNVNVQALRINGQTLDDVFTYTVTDAGGLTSTTQVTVTIRGRNDNPIGVNDTNTAVEAGGVTNGTTGTNPTGNVLTNDTDVDSNANGETKTVSAVGAGSLANTSGYESNVASSVTGNYGSINIAADGSYTYTVDNNNVAVQALRLTSQTLDDVFTYQVVDAGGLTSLATISVTIQGSNDAPTAVADTNTAIEAGGVANGASGTNPTGNVLTNDTDVDSIANGETKTVAGVAAGSVSSSVGSVASVVNGLYGSINIAANGAYTYTVDNTNAAVQALRLTSQTLDDVFTYTMLDASGIASTTQITITIQGSNDNPVGVNDTNTAVEAGGIANATTGTNPTGNVLANDTDVDTNANGETKTVNAVGAGSLANTSGYESNVASSVTGTYGSINIAADGSYTYTVDNSNAAVQALRLTSQTLDDVFTYEVVDAGGLTDLATITITIQGSNDNPIAVVDNGTAVEAGGIANGTTGSNGTGNVLTNDTDLDSNANGETKTVTGVAAGSVSSSAGSVASVVIGTYGSITIDANGSYTYTIDDSNAAVQALRINGQTLDDVFTYTVTDAGGLTSTTQLTITVHGRNDNPVGVNDTATAVEAGGVANGTSGTNPTGNVLTNDTDVDSNANGETKNVNAVVAGAQSSASGNVGSAVTGTYGSINIAANGSYTYTVDNSNAAVQALRLSSQTLDDVFTYEVVDAGGLTSLATITVTIEGRNDTPHDLSTAGLSITEYAIDGTVVGSVAGSDVDSSGNGETKTYSLVDDAGGRFAINSATGQITLVDTNLIDYDADPSHTIMVRVTDASSTTYDENFIVTVNDGNATPTAVSDSNTAVEAGGVANGSTGTNPTGNVLTNDTDPDTGDTKTVSGVLAGIQASASGNVGSAVNGSYGSLNIASDGSYTYSVDNTNAAVQALRLSGQTLTDVFTYTMVDSGALASTAQITITIEGRNDNPVGVNDTNTVVEAGGVSNGTVGTNPTGNVLTNDTDVDSNANGETRAVNAVGAGSLANTSGYESNVASSVAGAYGSITIAADGSYTYTVDNSNAAVQALRLSSQALDDIFTYEVVDAGGLTSLATITITIQGSNDNPVANVDNADAVEAGGISNATNGANGTGNVLSNDTDVDSNANGETKTVTGVAAGVQSSSVGSVSSVVNGSYGSITIDANGSYTYAIDDTNAAVQALRINGQTLDDVFTYTVTDAGGLTSTTQLTITVHGRNDNPVGVNDTNTAVEEGGVTNGTAGTNPTGNVLTNDSDVDSNANGETKTVNAVVAGSQSTATGNVGSTVTGTYGSINIAANGSYTYTVDNSNAAVQALRLSSQTLDDIFTYEVVDAGGLTSLATITITIQGSNDNPVANVDNADAVEAGGITNGTAGSNGTGNVLANDTDVDSNVNGETKNVTGVAAGVQSSSVGSVSSVVNGSYGSITIAANGSYTYAIDDTNSAVQALRINGQTLDDVFTYTATDSGGLTSTTQLTVTIRGRNDNPVGVNDTNTAVEAGGVTNGTAGTNPTGNVLTNDTDVDSNANGETKTVNAVVGGSLANHFR